MVEEDGPDYGPGAPGSSGSARMTLVSFSPQVTHLLIKRPPLFHYRPGDYLYLNIPSIARYEWHPFTISSAPEQKGRSAPTPPVPQGVLLHPCHVPSKAVNQEHRGKQDPRHKLASRISLWYTGADVQMLTKWGDRGYTEFCEGHRGGPDLVGDMGRVALQLNLEGFAGVY